MWSARLRYAAGDWASVGGAYRGAAIDYRANSLWVYSEAERSMSFSQKNGTEDHYPRFHTTGNLLQPSLQLCDVPVLDSNIPSGEGSRLPGMDLDMNLTTPREKPTGDFTEILIDTGKLIEEEFLQRIFKSR